MYKVLAHLGLSSALPALSPARCCFFEAPSFFADFVIPVGNGGENRTFKSEQIKADDSDKTSIVQVVDKFDHAWPEISAMADAGKYVFANCRFKAMVNFENLGKKLLDVHALEANTGGQVFSYRQDRNEYAIDTEYKFGGSTYRVVIS